MPVTNYDTLHGEIIAEYTDGVQLDYLKDALGSVTAWVDQNCNIVATARYKPFGDILVSTGTLGRFTWVGTLGYRSSGLTWADKYVRARHYGSQQGQWTTVDPIWPGEMAYGYASSNPATKRDRRGLFADDLGQAGAIVGAVVGSSASSVACPGDPCRDNSPMGGCIAAMCSVNAAADAILGLKDIPDCWKDIAKRARAEYKDRDKNFSPSNCCKKAHEGGWPSSKSDGIALIIGWICSSGKTGCPLPSACRDKFPGNQTRCNECCGIVHGKGSPLESKCLYFCS